MPDMDVRTSDEEFSRLWMQVHDHEERTRRLEALAIKLDVTLTDLVRRVEEMAQEARAARQFSRTTVITAVVTIVIQIVVGLILFAVIGGR